MGVGRGEFAGFGIPGCAGGGVAGAVLAQGGRAADVCDAGLHGGGGGVGDVDEVDCEVGGRGCVKEVGVDLEAEFSGEAEEW